MAVPVSGGDADVEWAGELTPKLHHHGDRFVDADNIGRQSFVCSVLPAARPAADTDHPYDGDDDGALLDNHDNDLDPVDEHIFEHIVFRAAAVLPKARPAADGVDCRKCYDCGADNNGIDELTVIRGAPDGGSYGQPPSICKNVLPHDGEAANATDERGADHPDYDAHDAAGIRPRRGPRNALSLLHYRAFRSRLRRPYDARRA